MIVVNRSNSVRCHETLIGLGLFHRREAARGHWEQCLCGPDYTIMDDLLWGGDNLSRK